MARDVTHADKDTDRLQAMASGRQVQTAQGSSRVATGNQLKLT